jgi:hypothetical protein
MTRLTRHALERAIAPCAILPSQSYIYRHSNTTVATPHLRHRLELPLSGRGVVANDGDGGSIVSRAARKLDDRTVEVTERRPGQSSPFSWCRRTLRPDGTMHLEVKKRMPSGRLAAMHAVASRVSEHSA